MALLKGLAVIYGLVFLMVGSFQERLIFFPEVLPAHHQFHFHAEFEEIWLKQEGHRIHSLLFKTPRSPGVLLFFHGNAGSMESWGLVAQEIQEQTGWDVWMLDYPGFGKSSGAIYSEEQLYDLGRLFLKAAKDRFGSNHKVVLYGRSVGAGIAVKIASENHLTGLILESPFYSLVSLAAKIYPWIPSFVLKYKFRSDMWIKDVQCPILVVHGTIDEIVPYAEGKRLSGLSKKAILAPIKGGGHNNISAFREYWEQLRKYLSSL